MTFCFYCGDIGFDLSLLAPKDLFAGVIVLLQGQLWWTDLLMMAEEDDLYPSRDKRRIPMSIFFKNARYYFNHLDVGMWPHTSSCLWTWLLDQLALKAKFSFMYFYLCMYIYTYYFNFPSNFSPSPPKMGTPAEIQRAIHYYLMFAGVYLSIFI